MYAALIFNNEFATQYPFIIKLCNKLFFINSIHNFCFITLFITIRLAFMQLYVLYNSLHAQHTIQHDYIHILRYCNTDVRTLVKPMLHECYAQL